MSYDVKTLSNFQVAFWFEIKFYSGHKTLWYITLHTVVHITILPGTAIIKVLNKYLHKITKILCETFLSTAARTQESQTSRSIQVMIAATNQTLNCIFDQII